MPAFRNQTSPRRAGPAKSSSLFWKNCCRLMSAFWHLADNPTAPEFVRYWTKADKVDCAGNRLTSLSAYRYSKLTLRPSSNPALLKALRNGARSTDAVSAPDCCARPFGAGNLPHGGGISIATGAPCFSRSKKMSARKPDGLTSRGSKASALRFLPVTSARSLSKRMLSLAPSHQ